MSTARWCAAFAGDTPTIEAAVVSEHPCSPSTCKSASLVGTAIARAMRTTWSKGSIDHSTGIETSARFARASVPLSFMRGHFHFPALSTAPLRGVDVRDARGRLRAGTGARHARHRDPPPPVASLPSVASCCREGNEHPASLPRNGGVKGGTYIHITQGTMAPATAASHGRMPLDPMGRMLIWRRTYAPLRSRSRRYRAGSSGPTPDRAHAWARETAACPP
jgi:hypothetical protein